jgi:hypothetical protein
MCAFTTNWYLYRTYLQIKTNEKIEKTRSNSPKVESEP